jgi:hypothetical protein
MGRENIVGTGIYRYSIRKVKGDSLVTSGKIIQDFLSQEKSLGEIVQYVEIIRFSCLKFPSFRIGAP